MTLRLLQGLYMKCNKKIVLFAPHQDDEILSACLYLKKKKLQSYSVSVVFVTNGDYNGKNGAIMRAKESIQALSLLGVEKKNIYFMGYADTGYQFKSSFLYKLYTASNENKIYVTQYNEKQTYHPLGFKTVHYSFFGNEAFYTKKNFLLDIETLLNNLHPDVIIIPSIYDSHYDHKALGYFFNDILNVKRGALKVYSYLIHSRNDLLWPDRNKCFFLRPPCVSQGLWDKRLIYEFSQEEVEWKRQVIKIFTSQSPEKFNNYLYSFAKKEEFFLLEYV